MDDQKSPSIAFLAISDQTATFIFMILFTKWLPAAILDDRKSLLIAFLAISDQYATFFFTKWLPAAILDDRKSLSIAFLAISDQYATFDFFLNSQYGYRRPFWMTENHFRMHFSPFQINTQLFFFKMAAGGHFGSLIWAILDDRKSLSIAFLAISDQFTTFFFIFFQNLEVRFAPKTIGFFHYVLSMAMPNMKLFGESMTQSKMPQAF